MRRLWIEKMLVGIEKDDHLMVVVILDLPERYFFLFSPFYFLGVVCNTEVWRRNIGGATLRGVWVACKDHRIHQQLGVVRASVVQWVFLVRSYAPVYCEGRPFNELLMVEWTSRSPPNTGEESKTSR